MNTGEKHKATKKMRAGYDYNPTLHQVKIAMFNFGAHGI